MNIGRPTPQRFDIRPGQTQNLQLPAGTVLYLRSGNALLREAPQWLGESLHRLSRRLHAGQSHVLTQTGWLELRAGDEAAVLELPSQPQPASRPQAIPTQGVSAWLAGMRHT